MVREISPLLLVRVLWWRVCAFKCIVVGEVATYPIENMNEFMPKVLLAAAQHHLSGLPSISFSVIFLYLQFCLSPGKKLSIFNAL
jgi:hypothetical protein